MPNLLLCFQVPNIFNISFSHLFINIIVISKLVMFLSYFDLPFVFLFLKQVFRWMIVSQNIVLGLGNIWWHIFISLQKSFFCNKIVYLQTTFAKYSPGVTNFFLVKNTFETCSFICVNKNVIYVFNASMILSGYLSEVRKCLCFWFLIILLISFHGTSNYYLRITKYINIIFPI